VLLFLKSSSGRIPAGSISLSLNALGSEQQRQSYGIEKCPDKDAVAEMSVACECLNEIDCVPPVRPSSRKSSPRQSETDPRVTFGLDKKPLKRSRMYEEVAKSTVMGEPQKGQGSLFQSHEGLPYSEPGKLTESLEDGSTRGPKHYTDYGSRSKLQQLEKEVKGLQAKQDQQNLELKN
jgi:hypothetical protein